MFENEARSALDLTRRLIERFGPRLAGSEAALGAAAELEREAAAHADRAWTEDFEVHPGAFLGFIKILVALYLMAALLLPFAAGLSALFTSVGLFILVFGFILYKEVLDPFYPRKLGRNVLAVLEPKRAPKRQLIFSGHHDSARVFNFYVDRPELYAIRVYGGIGSFALLWAASLALALASPPRLVLVVAALIFLADFYLVAPLWNFAAKGGTPGAGDNLAASAAALAMLKALRARREAGEGLDSTRIVFASFDAEEAGLRGARAWARAHRAEVAGLPSFCFNMDCLYRAEELRFLTTDLNGSIGLSRPLAEAAAKAANAARTGDPAGGKPRPAIVEPIAFLTGGTDAAELAKIGVQATTLIAMKWSNEARSAAYHTPADTIEAVDPEVIEAAIAVGLSLASAIDRGELDAAPERRNEAMGPRGARGAEPPSP